MTESLDDLRLPIHGVLGELRAALNGNPSVVLEAPPGAGKTTIVPLALLGESWLKGQGILLLEPRRLAARAAALRMAELLGEPLGQTVGLRMRGETTVSDRTRITVMTEGVLTRTLQNDPELGGIGLVVFDEFHERSLQADLGLALTLDSQEALREDLKILVMSATLDGERISALLRNAPVVSSEGRSFPVETEFLPRGQSERLEEAVARAVEQACGESDGDLLVFLPGAAEIERSREALARTHSALKLHALYGALSKADQDGAIRPDPNGHRKVVLATNIAESSITIQGVAAVIDSGLERIPRYNPSTGLTALETVRISKASATQRAGRAGRLRPGHALRLWAAHDEALMPAQARAEICEADLAPLVLELAGWGVRDPEALRWLDSPAGPRWDEATLLLTRLEALDPDGRITPHGRDLLALGLHPRLGHMVVRARALDCESLATELAVLLEERDILNREAGPDLRLRFDALHAGDQSWGSGGGLPVHRGALHRVREGVKRRLRGRRVYPTALDHLGLLLSLAYPERIAKRREPGRPVFRLASGQGARLQEERWFHDEAFLAVARVDGRDANGRIDLAFPISEAEIREVHGSRIVGEEVVCWNGDRCEVEAVRRERIDALILSEGPLTDPDEGAVQAALLEGLRTVGLSLLAWGEDAVSLQQRVGFLRALEGNPFGLPDLSDAAVLEGLAGALASYLAGCRRAADLKRIHGVDVMNGLLGYEGMKRVEEQAPERMAVPSGSTLRIEYSGEQPVLAVRVQEVFGLAETPRIAGGRVPLLLHLLSPANRPVHITADLASFWARGYAQVRKDLRARYAKHFWPEDPTSAPATRTTKKRMRGA
ncbi:MAG: ATP-dependent helicase HrpB [Planctomycetota bacterium]|jgi:ATP-dependent helicase HrpB